jgi:hypothetical protein
VNYQSIEIQMAKVFMDRKDIAKRIVDSELALGQLVLKEAEDKRAVEEYQNKLKILRSDGLVYIASYRIIKTSLIDKIAILETSKIAVLLEKQKLVQLNVLSKQLEFQYRSLEGLATKALNNVMAIMGCQC